MAEAEQSPSQSGASTTTRTAEKYFKVPFGIWPPTECTHEATRNRLIETLSTPSILSKRYGIISRDEAIDVAKLIEEEAFDCYVGILATIDVFGDHVLVGIFYLVGFALFCLESLLSLWVL